MTKIVATSLLAFILPAFILISPVLAAEGDSDIAGADAAGNDKSLQEIMEKVDRMEKYLKELQDQIVILMDIIDHVEKESARDDTTHADLDARNREVQKQVELLGKAINANREKIDLLYRQYRFDFVDPGNEP